MSLEDVKEALEAGRDFYINHDNDGACKKFEEALSMLDKEPVSSHTERLRAEAHLGIIEAMDNAGRWLPALEYAGILMNESAARGDKRTEIAARLLSCQIHLHRGNWDEAKNRYKAAMEVSEKANNKRGVAESYYGLGYVDWRKGDINGSKFKLKKALKMLEDQGETILRCKAVILSATVEDAIGNSKEAIDLFKSAIESLKNFPPGEELARAYNNLGEVYKSMEDYASAAEQYDECAKVSEIVGSKRGYLYGLSNLAECYAFTNRTDEAKRVLDQVERVLEQAQEKYIAAQVPHIRGLILYNKKEYEEANQELKRGIAGLGKIGNPPYDLGIFWYRYALSLRASKDEEKAKYAFEKAEKCFRDINAKLYLKKLAENK